MRKVLLFLLLLVVGLLLIYWLDPRMHGAAKAPLEPVELPPEPAEHETQGLQLGGPASATFYDKVTKRALSTLKSTGSRTEGHVDLLTGVVVELYDPAEENVVQARLTAERGRLTRVDTPGAMHPNWEPRVELEGVETLLVKGFPLAPLSFRSKTALVDLRDPQRRLVHSDDEFTARSPELSFDGRGLECLLDEGRIEIAHRGRVELRPESTTPGAFTSTGDGPLHVIGAAVPGAPVTLEAWQGARLELQGENPGNLVAEHIRIQAQPSGPVPPDAEPGSSAPLAVRTLDADGSVDWNSGDSVFQGQRATATFAPGGRLEHARLEDSPRAELELAPAIAPAPLPAGSARRQVTIIGKDALDITWHESPPDASSPAGFDLASPGLSTVETPDFRLKSATGITGFLAEDRASARFAASGGVEVTSGDATLEAGAFEVSMNRDAEGGTELHGKATGGASLVRVLPPKEPGQEARRFTLSSPDGLSIERTAKGWKVLDSTRVEVALDGPDGFRARADRVRDLDLARWSFTADGAISVVRGTDSFGGEHLDFLAYEPVWHFRLTGTEQARAFSTGEFAGTALEATALEMEVTGSSLTARGEVRASGKKLDPADPAHWESLSDELSLDYAEAPELIAGERLRTLRTTLGGHVEATYSLKDETTVVRCNELAFEGRDRLVAGERQELGSLLTAQGKVHATVLRKAVELDVDCDHFEGERTQSDLASGFRSIVASGDVRFQGGTARDANARAQARAREFAGEGELLVYGADGHGSLEPAAGGRVMLLGREENGQPFRLTAERIDFDLAPEGPEHITAQRPEIKVAGKRARAEHLSSDAASSFVLTGGVHMSGAIKSTVPFTLDASRVEIVGRRASAEPAPVEPAPDGAATSGEDSLDALLADGSVDFHLGQDVRVRGEKLAVRRASGLLRIDGAPATFETPFARLETEWAEFDPALQVLVATGRGRMYSLEEGPPQAQGGAAEAPGWSLDFLASSSLLEMDSLVFVVQEPVFHTAQYESVLRASWVVMWLNREAFQDSGRRDDLLAGLKSVVERFRSLPKNAGWNEILALFRSQEISGILREIYFEGPVEALSDGELLARADAIYLDAVSQHGWLARATLNMAGQFVGKTEQKLIVKADWLRISSDASLRADHATVTSCDFDEPHVRVVTGDLRIDPLENQGKARFRLRLKDNRIELYDWLKIPLPTIDVNTNKDLEPLWPSLSLGNSARIGTFFSFAFTRPADGIAHLIDKLRSLFSSEPAPEKPAAPGTPTTAAAPAKKRAKSDGHYKINGSFLGSRGTLLDLGLEIEAKDDYWLDLYLGLAVDNGKDRGFIRVPGDERDNLRRWLRAQAYFDNGDSGWTLAYTDQSDAGVQAEFFENQFLRYERTETYAQWHRSWKENFAEATAKVRIDDFRTDVEELPSFSVYRGRSPILRIGALSLIHTGDLSAAYLLRREGRDPSSPFGLPSTFRDGSLPGFGALDGLGDRDVLRVDSNQELELPVPLGAGWKLTPFVSARGTAWNEGQDSGDSPLRLISQGGARLGVSYWKRGENGLLNQIAPFIQLSSQLARDDTQGTPVEFDSVERALSGDFLSFGSRARLGVKNDADAVLDCDLVGTYASGRSDGAPDGWMPIEVFARLIVAPFGQEVEVFHDARYDVENNTTVYSLLSVGTHVEDEWGIQASHQRGLDENGNALFEAASVSGLYRWTEKWEFQARESFSLLEGGRLDSSFVLRRYGHDVILDLETGVREGEGSTVGLSFRPRFGYRPPHVGYVPW